MQRHFGDVLLAPESIDSRLHYSDKKLQLPRLEANLSSNNVVRSKLSSALLHSRSNNKQKGC